MQTMKLFTIVLVLSLALILLKSCSAEQCGSQAGGPLGPTGFAVANMVGVAPQTITVERTARASASQAGAQPRAQPRPPLPPAVAAAAAMLEASSVLVCSKRQGFCPYNEAFMSAAVSFGGFGTTGDGATRKRELAAFFGQISHEITGL